MEQNRGSWIFHGELTEEKAEGSGVEAGPLITLGKAEAAFDGVPATVDQGAFFLLSPKLEEGEAAPLGRPFKIGSRVVAG